MLLQIHQLSGNSSGREGGLVQMKPHHCNNNPESTFWWEQISNAIYREEENRQEMKIKLTDRNSHIRHLSHEIHTFLPLQRWMVNCVWMKHKNGYQWATSLVEWVTQKQVTFLLGSRFWQADPHSKLSLLNRIHQITTPCSLFINYTCQHHHEGRREAGCPASPQLQK